MRNPPMVLFSRIRTLTGPRRLRLYADMSSLIRPPPGLDLGYGLDKGHKQQQNVPPMYGGQNMPFYGHGHPPPGFNPMYFMGNQMGPGVPNFPMFGPGMMNHMGMAGQYGGEGNGVGPGFDGERAWYLR
ncbi:hypothetical protein F2Q69_00016421 [Brassica cretica]|uniref:Uncharacterized protein n=1 Tax=Brassica cretica TaxID=69181 RepID=A0A8S9QZP0_BRACR|nr:hypothetical protein F2Q69_00016421 [Brassica cretica]